MKKTKKNTASTLKRSTRRKIRFSLKLLAICLALILAYGFYFYAVKPILKTAQSHFYQASKEAGFEVKYVEFSGIKNASKASLLKLSGIREGQPLFKLDIHNARLSMISNNWVKDVEIERQIPDTVFIKVTERTPIAVWQNNGNLALIDEEGQVFKEKSIMPFLHLPIVVGEDAPERAMVLLQSLQSHPKILNQIRSMTWISERRWNINFKNGILIKLPEEDISTAWEKLAEIANTEEYKTDAIKEIDFRLPGKIYIKK